MSDTETRDAEGEYYDPEADHEADEYDQRTIDEKAREDFEEILRAAKESSFDTEKNVNAFEKRFQGRLQAKNKTYGTVLHVLVDSFRDAPDPFIKWLLKRWPELIKETGDGGKTPLHVALEIKRPFHKFVELVIENGPDNVVAEALATQDERGWNCLHQAIATRFRSTLKLIEKCSPDTFTARNKDDNTPLHEALKLDYIARKAAPPRNQPPPSRGQLLSATKPNMSSPTTRRDPANTLRANDQENISGDELKNKPKDKGPPPMFKKNEPLPKNEVRSQDVLSKNITNADSASRSEDASAPSKNSKPMQPGKLDSSRGRPTPTTAVDRRPNVFFYLPEVVQSLMLHSEQSMLAKYPLQPRTPYQYWLHLLPKKMGRPAAEEDVIGPKMKEFVLRNMSREKAIDALYEKGKEKHIEFDLSSLPSTSISETDLDRLSRHLTFENMLKYVALPKLKVEDPGRDKVVLSPTAHESQYRNLRGSLPEPPKPPRRDRIGLTDATIIFKWLSMNKVDQINHVIVIDDGETPHSDEAIEDALSGFQVEIWDWKKMDISSDTIFRAAGEHVRIVYLYASGNSAVLKGWSCEEGLVKLSKLQNVHLIIRRGLETEDRRTEDLKTFKDEFYANWEKKYDREPPEVNVIPDDKPKSYASVFQNDRAPEIQKWLIHTDTMAQYIANISVERESANRAKAQAKSEEGSNNETSKLEDIRVAVIDDGIDGFQDDLIDNIASGVSFCHSSDSGNLMRAYYVPSGGHGTMMARLICRLCPKAKLYVARLEEHRSSNGKRQITARSAAEAIRWAITKEVHIISMSWTIEGSVDQADISALGNEIKAAQEAHIIMVCSFSDQGNNSSLENSFPGAWKPACWTIGAATTMGDACTWVDREKVDFLFPGEQIVVDQKSSRVANASTGAGNLAAPTAAKAENGSSISTALAAGTVAMLLFLTQLVHPEFYKRLKQPERMKAALEKHCNRKYFRAQDLFDLHFSDARWDWELEEGKKQVRILVRTLMTQAEQSGSSYSMG